MTLSLVRPPELCAHQRALGSCYVCWPEAVMSRLESRIVTLETENADLTLRLAEEVRKRGEVVRHVAKIMEVKP